VGASAVYLVEQQLLPLARACEVMGDLLGVQMSEGTIWELIKRCVGLFSWKSKIPLVLRERRHLFVGGVLSQPY